MVAYHTGAVQFPQPENYLMWLWASRGYITQADDLINVRFLNIF
jgi:hypothetical protein